MRRNLRQGPYYTLPVWTLVFLWPVYALAAVLKAVLLPFTILSRLLRRN